MLITKRELIALLREDACYQRSELNCSGIESTIRINGIALHHNRNMRLILNDDHALIGYKQDGVTYTLANVTYDKIHSIGYKYSNEEKLAKRVDEIRYK